MKLHPYLRHLLGPLMIGMTLSACTDPPYNNFEQKDKAVSYGTIGAGAGATVTAVASSAVTPLTGAAIGGLAGIIIGKYQDSPQGLEATLSRQDVQIVKYGRKTTLIIPTDKFYLPLSDTLNELCYPALNNIVKLIKTQNYEHIYVAGFTDDVGSIKHRRSLSQGQAQALMTFLWANDIKSEKLTAMGYASHYNIANNRLIHGSAMNRRVEIQWQSLG